MENSTDSNSTSNVIVDNLEPRPLQIMDFAKPKKENVHSDVIFHQDVFKQIVMKTKTDKVAFLSIAGPSRKGKSFFLNFVLRYLYGKENNKTNWLQSDERLDGFAWKNSTDRVTKGIWLWSEPFQMKSTKGDDFDLLIMDTQGVFDEHTSLREWSILVGLGLLASSCLIFNVVGDIQEDGLLIFEKFLDFGLMALNEDNRTTPFQNLLFLVRDWNVPVEFSYGFNGGRRYLRSKLDAKNSHKEAHKKIRQQLKKCFDDISCCLLPHPGEEFLTQNTIGGSVCQRDDKFLAEIGKCIPEILDPLNIPLKKINGNYVSAADILHTFSKYCDFFNSDDMLTPNSIFQIMSEHSNDLVIKNGLQNFKNELKTHLTTRPFFLGNDLFEIKETAMHMCLKRFDQSRIMGDRNLSKAELSRQLAESYKVIKHENAQNRKIFTSKAFDTASMAYNDMVALCMKDGYLSSSTIDSLLLESERKVCSSFSSSCGVEYIDMLPDEAVKFQQFFQSKNQEFRNDNLLKKVSAEKSLNDEIQNLVAVYVKNMEDGTHGRIVSEKQMEELHDISKKQCIDEFNALQVNNDFICEAERNMNTRIADKYERICKDILSSNEKIDSVGNTLVTQAASTYFSSAKEKITANKGDFEQIQKKLLRLAQKTVIDGCPIEDDQFLKRLCRQLIDEIALENLKLNDILERNGTEIMTKSGNAKDEAIDMYKLALNEIMPKGDWTPVESDKLDEIHTREMQKSTKWLGDVFQKLCETYQGIDNNFFVTCNAEVESSIKSVYDSIKQINALKQSNVEAKAVEIFAKTKESYGSRMKEHHPLTNEEDLRWLHSGIKKDLSENLKGQLAVLCLSSEQKENFLKNLHSYIESEWKVILEVWRMRMAEDDIIVRTAFLDAKEFYKNEIEKHLQSKDWLEVSELQKLHEMLLEASIEKGRTEVDISESQELQLRDMIENLFKKYQDRNSLRMPTDDYAIGIDLGTTYSCVAVCIKGKVTVISQNEKKTIPSYVAFKDDHTVDVGDAAKEQSFRRPEYTIFDAKRLIGRKFSDKIVQDDMILWPFEVVNSYDQPKIKIPGHCETYFPEAISARVLAQMKKMAEDFLKKKVKNAVVTVPAYFSESQRHATKDAAQIAGLNAKILNEPTAAAISYELHRTDDFSRNVLIFDLGGGTFDVAVLKMNGGEVNVRAINGDTHLGGEDFDNEMVKHIIKVVKEKYNIDLGRDRDSSDPELRHSALVRLRRIRSACEQKKRLLSTSLSVKIIIEKIDGNFDLDETFTRAQFEALNLAKFKICIDITATVISDAEMVKSDIDDIVLIGGSTRIPKIVELLTQFFNGKALNQQIDADEAGKYFR